MPRRPVIEIHPEQQAQMLAAWRCARYGGRLTLQGRRLCAARHPRKTNSRSIAVKRVPSGLNRIT
jgi:hypothetical protein